MNFSTNGVTGHKAIFSLQQATMRFLQRQRLPAARFLRHWRSGVSAVVSSAFRLFRLLWNYYFPLLRCGVLPVRKQRRQLVIADPGFLIEDELRELGVKLNRPPMLNGRRQLTVTEETRTRQIANLRRHVERVIREVKNLRIPWYVFPNAMADKPNRIRKICCYLSNFTHEPLLNW